jgi:hypothetical protein
MSDKAKLHEIRAKLDAIAPWPEGGTVTAAGLGRHFAVRAQERWTRGLSMAGPELDGQQIALMIAEFAAAHALCALAEQDTTGPEDEGSSAFTAAQIRDAISDGGEIGPWLFEHLGKETSQAVAALAEQLAEAQSEASHA